MRPTLALILCGCATPSPMGLRETLVQAHDNPVAVEGVYRGASVVTRGAMVSSGFISRPSVSLVTVRWSAAITTTSPSVDEERLPYVVLAPPGEDIGAVICVLEQGSEDELIGYRRGDSIYAHGRFNRVLSDNPPRIVIDPCSTRD